MLLESIMKSDKFSWRRITVKKKKLRAESTWLMGEAGGSWRTPAELPLQIFSCKSVTQMIISMLIQSPVCILLRKKPVSKRSPSPSGSIVKVKGGGEIVTWEAKGEWKEWGEKLDKDRYRWVVGAQMLLGNSSALGKQTSICSLTHSHYSSCRRPRRITVILSIQVCVRKCNRTGLTTPLTKTTNIETTVLEISDKDKSLKTWVAFQCPDVFYLLQFSTGS